MSSNSFGPSSAQNNHGEQVPTMLKNLTLAAAIVIAISVPAAAEPLVYVAAGSANEVIIIDAASDTVVGSFSGVENPHGIVATPDGEYLVAGSLKEEARDNQNPGEPNSNLALIHPDHGHVMLTIPIAGMTHHQAITPDGRYVISTHSTRGYVSVVDLNSNSVVKTVPTGPAPNFTVITKDGKTAYVSNSGNGTVSEIDIPTWSVTRSLEAGPGPEHLVFSKGEKILYAINPRAGTVSAISVAEGKVNEVFKVGQSLHGLDISDDGSMLFVSSKKDNKLVALNPETGDQRELPLSPSPYHLESIVGTGKVYVSSSEKPKIWVVDQKTLALLGEIPIRGNGHQMAVVYR